MKISFTQVSFLVIVMFCTATCFGQANYKKALILKPDGDSLSGFVDYRNWYRNPVSFSFKSSLDGQAEVYTASNISFIEIKDYTSYQRFAVRVSMNEVQFDRLSEASQADREDTVFLQLLVAGKNVNLYAYRDEVKQRFYILEKNQARPVELNYKVALVDGAERKYYPFRQQLVNIAQRLNDVNLVTRSAIDRASYLQEDLVKITRSLNGDQSSRVIKTEPRKKSKHFFITAGVNYSRLSYTRENLLTAEGVDNSDTRLYQDRKTSSLFPLINFGTDIYFNSEIQRIYLTLEASATGFTSEVNSTYKFSMYTVEELSNNYQLSAALLSFRPQLLMNVLNKENLKCYLAAGPSLHYMLPFKNEMYQKTNQQAPGYSDKQDGDYLEIKSVFASAIIKAGVTVNKKIDISLSAYSPVELVDLMASKTSAKFNALQLAVGYKLKN